MERYVRIGADYGRGYNSYYDFILEDTVTKKMLKKWFKRNYNWLKIHECYEIPKEKLNHPMRLGFFVRNV